METVGKSPVNIIQELIAMHTTRRDAYEKIRTEDIDDDMRHQINSYQQQSQDFIEELMEELSAFGDAVSGEVDRDNPVNNTWKEALESVDSMDKPALKQTVQSIEENLHKSYREFLDGSVELTGWMREVVQKQAEAL